MTYILHHVYVCHMVHQECDLLKLFLFFLFIGSLNSTMHLRIQHYKQHCRYTCGTVDTFVYYIKGKDNLI